MFEKIRNQKTLWEKSILVIDRDFIMDKHYLPNSSKANHKTIPYALSEILKMPVFMPSAYTFEATLFTNMAATTRLLQSWLSAQDISLPDTLANTLGNTLNNVYKNTEVSLAEKNKDDKAIKQAVQQHIDFRDSLILKKDDKLFFDKNQTYLAVGAGITARCKSI